VDPTRDAGSVVQKKLCSSFFAREELLDVIASGPKVVVVLPVAPGSAFYETAGQIVVVGVGCP
jgi:hypothetical protein